ncbi:Fe-S protein assembly co-chaperone HscB [Kangiella koreensis]|uniref:Co-chaperone protein HscB homolog n=1 Tax=Kangiella koreensis (strain DSM 16069 / JCM 12317 / KCTC 12182 / SW-125) TaxID=523791 RepID=C7RCC3_KANKD|nr:Fe-S protein assembly co-chaperone HscB [Kangiella koreensis]ACV26915.1 co-chaperone Hsc20 [Kangiella koreensis DSM 16069]
MANSQQNYFEMFGLEPNFSIDIPKVSAKLRTLLNSVHPDRFASSGAQQQMLSMQKTTQLNDAFAVLKNPVKRAQYLLRLKTGIDTAKDHTVNDPEFLMQQLELREELEDIVASGDISRLNQFADKISELEEKQEEQMSELFAHQPLNTEELEKAIYKLQFLHKTLSDIEQAEDKLIS